MIALGFNPPALGGASVVSGAVGFHLGPTCLTCLLPFAIVVAILGLCRIVVAASLWVGNRKSRSHAGLARGSALVTPLPSSHTPRPQISGEASGRAAFG